MVLTARRARSVTLAVLVVLLVVVSALALLASSGHRTRSDARQQVLDGLVTGHGAVAPGVTAYVSGPKGSWSGAAGLANVEFDRRMPRDAPMHLDSLTKLWVSTITMQLVGEGRMSLDDPADRWLRGILLDPRITVRQLLDHTSGLVNKTDLRADRDVARVADPGLRAQLADLTRREAADPATQAPPSMWVRWAAALPLLTAPGSTFHYSNVGYEAAGMIAEAAGGAPLATLFHDRIAAPLHLTTARYDATGGRVGRVQPHDYNRHGGTWIDATGQWRTGIGGSAALVASVRDEARFATALMRGRLVSRAALATLLAPSGPSTTYGLGVERVDTGCGGVAYGHRGSGYASTSQLIVSADGSRVAVVAVNGNVLGPGGKTLDPRTGRAVEAAARRLFCGA